MILNRALCSLDLVTEEMKELVVMAQSLCDGYWETWRAMNESIAKGRAKGTSTDFPGEIAPIVDTPNKNYPSNVYFTYKRFSKKNSIRKVNASFGVRISANESRKSSLNNIEKHYSDSLLRRVSPGREWEYELLKKHEDEIRPIRELYAINIAHTKQLKQIIKRIETKGK